MHIAKKPNLTEKKMSVITAHIDNLYSNMDRLLGLIPKDKDEDATAIVGAMAVSADTFIKGMEE